MGKLKTLDVFFITKLTVQFRIYFCLQRNLIIKLINGSDIFPFHQKSPKPANQAYHSANQAEHKIKHNKF